VEATRGVDLYLTGPLHKVIDGQTCRKKHGNMGRRATNAKSLRQTFTNQEESLILCPALGLLLNGVWIL